MHDFFAVRERYEHTPFTVSCIVQVLNYFVTLGNVSVPITINKHDNAVVHVIGAERVTSQVVKLELCDYWVSLSFINYMLYSQSLYRDHEALFHHKRRQSSNVVLVAEFFTFCREVFFGCLFCLFLQELPPFCFTLRVIRSRERNIETSFFEIIFSESSDGSCSVRSHIVPVLADKSNRRWVIYRIVVIELRDKEIHA